jgi:outer membrane protein assembly factor BamA
MNKKTFIVLVLLVFGCAGEVSAQKYLNNYTADTNIVEIQIRNVYIDRKQVFEPTDKDWFFGSKLANTLHYLTREYIIRDELLFTPDSIVNESFIDETERNLRASDLFTNVKIKYDSVTPTAYDVYVTTKDRWSFYPEALIGVGGDNYQYGARLTETNLLGAGIFISAEALHRSESNIGWQEIFQLNDRRLFRSELGLQFNLLYHQFRTDYSINLEKPYRTLDTKLSYGLLVENMYGYDFKYNTSNNYDKLYLHKRLASLFFSRGWMRQDRVFASALFEVSDVVRPDTAFNQAYDNGGKILIQFSSVTRNFHKVSHINQYHEEDMPTGGYGQAVIGYAFPLFGVGERLYYVAGEGEQSYYQDGLYLYGRVQGSSSFADGNAKYTYEEASGLAFYQFNKLLILGARLQQQTVWNWHKYHQLILDNESGLIGYRLNGLTGDNRIIGNLELRVFPDWRLWVFDLSGVAFWDIGTVWNETVAITKAQWHNALGAGIRFHFTKSSSLKNTFRIDASYNFDERGFGSITFGNEQHFNFFGTHDYKKPKIFGTQYDYE